MKRIIPHSKSCEQTVLGSVFLDGAQTLSLCLDAKVNEHSFYIPANQLVWKTIVWAAKRGTPLEVGPISEALREKGKLDDIGGIGYLLNITEALPTTAGTASAIETLQRLYTLRELIKKSSEIIDNAYSFEGDFAVFSQQIEDALKIREGLEKPKTLSEACDDTIDLLRRIGEGEKMEGYSWPFAGMDERLDMAEGGELVVVAARPSRGKSSFARQVAYAWAAKYGDVAFFSREMPVGQLPQLFAQSLCGLSWREARKNKMHKADVQTLVDSIREVQQNTKLHIFDKDSTASQICARIKAMKQTKQIKAVFIDYLQAYDVEQIKGETRDMAIGRFTRSMKDIALDLGIPVILLAQLSRSVEKEEREPRASDLRESGNIEQDADRIIFCHWNASDSMGVPVDFNDSTLKTIESQLIQVKNRNGTSGKQDVLFNRPTTTFRTLAKID